MQMKIDAIQAGRGHRQDLGDLADLMDSIGALGLLHDVLVTKEGVLVCGRHRLEACKRLGWKEIGCKVVDIDALRAEQDENTCRLDFTPSERVGIKREIEERERDAARKRKEATQPKKGEQGAKPRPENFTGHETGDARDIIAKKVGMSATTLKKAEEIVEAAEAEPEIYADLQRKMDATGKVDPVHKELRERKAEAKPEGQKAAPAVQPQWSIEDDIIKIRKAFDRVIEQLSPNWETKEDIDTIRALFVQLSREV